MSELNLSNVEIYDSGAAWYRMEIEQQEDGSVLVRHVTNDDLDQGYPSRWARWSTWYFDEPGKPALSQALKDTGRSRQGIGCIVHVFLNGQAI